MAWENSRSAFRAALELGADGVELDVHATRDGAIVVHHDPVVPGLGPIAERDWRECGAARLPNGEPLPLLAEVLDLLGNVVVWVEVKALPSAHDTELLAVLDAGPAPAKYAVHSFDHRIVRRLRDRRAGLSLGCLLSSRLIDPVPAVRAAGADTLWQEAAQIDAALVETVHAADLVVIAWTVNDDADARRLAALGVDALCGNHPDRLRGAIRGASHAP